MVPLALLLGAVRGLLACDSPDGAAVKAGEVWLARLRGQRYVQRVMIDELSDRCVRAIPIDPYNVIDDRFYEIGKDIEFVEKLNEPPPEIRKVL